MSVDRIESGPAQPVETIVRRGFDEPFEKLQRVERRAAGVFSPDDLPSSMRDNALPIDTFETGRDEGLLWVAEASGKPIGFILLVRLDDYLHVREINVVPEFAGRGIGRALMTVALEHARTLGVREITLTTFEHLPWNGPFYESCGFVAVADADAPQQVADKLRAERAAGLEHRIAMILRLDKGRHLPT